MYYMICLQLLTNDLPSKKLRKWLKYVGISSLLMLQGPFFSKSLRFSTNLHIKFPFLGASVLFAVNTLIHLNLFLS